LGLTSALSTAYHPQTDGTTERVNQEIEAYLSIYCSTHPEEWLYSLATLEFTHNDRRHADRLKTPFELILGDMPIAVPLSFENTKFPTIEEKNENSDKKLRGSSGCTRTSTHTDDGTTKVNIYSL
jgi:hypothetical protein